ncbi:hypothetical protein GJ744_001977 [Endocarpon pusillum]|uniref:Glutathione S-transferase n=1 Tax=Endocarpon pusillum TaxID=364733 RepID=A0A8H7ACN3_9EURO|nr:hypothetical protein GJ744_001977 [Endocarpon pusillum]
MSTPVGITVPKMLPITGTWTLPLTAYFFLLSARVSQLRMDSKKSVGNKTSEAEAAGNKPDPLEVAIRSHANYVENVPMALLAAAIVELNGGNRKILNGGLAALLLFRILHVEFGMRGVNARGPGRVIGHAGTAGFLGGMSAYAAYLVKGYWGF